MGHARHTLPAPSFTGARYHSAMPDLADLFARGTLVRPTDSEPNLIHLIRAIAARAGVPDLDTAPAVKQLLELIAPAQHLIFVLLDGMGMNLLRRLPTESFMARSLRREIRAVCPSTTACALTTVATAAYPNQHGATGWFIYLADRQPRPITIATLPFVERFSGESLASRGIKVEDVLSLPPILPRMKCQQTLVLTPPYIAHTPYNVWSRGGTPGVGYTSIPNAVDQIVERITSAGNDKTTYTHWYMPDIDSICHHKGVEHPDVIPLVMGIDAELGRLAERLAGRARIIVSADHGLIDVPRENQVLLRDGDPMLDWLAVPPTGDARMPIFHVREGRDPQGFAAAFNERFGNRMILIPTSEAERLDLFGPGRMSPAARQRFGHFIALTFCPATLSYHPSNKPVGELFIAVHAGLSPQEMWVPLCVA
jgi:hypothetical protein